QGDGVFVLDRDLEIITWLEPELLADRNREHELAFLRVEGGHRRIILLRDLVFATPMQESRRVRRGSLSRLMSHHPARCSSRPWRPSCFPPPAELDKNRAKVSHRPSAARTSEVPRAQAAGQPHRMP